MADTTKQEYVLWPYTPSIAGGATAAIVFALLTSAHVFRLIKNRTWFCIPFVIGALVCQIIVSQRNLTNPFRSSRQLVTPREQQHTMTLSLRLHTSSNPF